MNDDYHKKNVRMVSEAEKYKKENSIFLPLGKISYVRHGMSAIYITSFQRPINF